MRSSGVLLTAFALLALHPLPALAQATDRDLYRSKVQRYTNDSSFVSKPKRLCVCLADNNPDDERMAGVLVDTIVIGTDGLRRVQVRCFVRRFEADGSSTTSEACSSTWALLH